AARGRGRRAAIRRPPLGRGGRPTMAARAGSGAAGGARRARGAAVVRRAPARARRAGAVSVSQDMSLGECREDECLERHVARSLTPCDPGRDLRALAGEGLAGGGVVGEGLPGGLLGAWVAGAVEGLGEGEPQLGADVYGARVGLEDGEGAVDVGEGL